MKYTVKRPHLGDKMYNVGDVRYADPNDIMHLIKGEILDLETAPDLDNKAEVIKRSGSKK